MGACLGVAVDLIGPTGFRTDDRALRRAGLDYLDRAALTLHAGWEDFDAARQSIGGRLVLFTTRATQSFLDLTFEESDTLLFGRESAGVPDDIHAGADIRTTIPMVEGTRSLNLAVSVAMGVTEALRQTGGLPHPAS
ncbi:tRNA (cytidine/uridine-2'-O-)-methyltransferase [Rhodobium gokarnense]|uniref:tRNA (Cytidine/uridine-2'-O-)-methyltransferase n=1 Tax=Rhodobium gokarnense TaxID=364296 RepID=A0ABT3H5R3_9HYPH|nr:tRNA (cytidine/uridine-2'-O-)-methyltransferase [Rhodobium gokarnense]